MAKYTVHLETTAEMVVDVEVPDGLDESEAREKAIEEAFETVPSDVCAQCSGWRQKWSLDLGEWELAREHDGTEIQPKLAD